MELLKRIDNYGDSVKHNLLTILSFVQIPIKFMNDIITRVTTFLKGKLKKENKKIQKIQNIVRKLIFLRIIHDDKAIIHVKKMYVKLVKINLFKMNLCTFF